MATDRNVKNGKSSSNPKNPYMNFARGYRTTAKGSGKKPLPEPIHVGHFIMMVVIKLCRTVLLVDTSVKIGVYLTGVLVGSVICDLFAFPRSYFSNKGNILNQWFVKLGWGWTLSLLLAYIFLTSTVYCCGNWNYIRRHLLRLAVGTFWWYVCTSLFVRVETMVGVCTVTTIKDKFACVEAGKSWLGFDISGHCFLLIHSLLIINEELKTFRDWSKLGGFLQDEELKDKRKVTEKEISDAQISFKLLTPMIKVNIIAITMLALLWELMLLISVIYRFHTLPQKVTASFIAVGCWFISYRILFRSKVEWLPLQPGESPLSYMKLS
ncbi:acyl-coenzyme A diphosphatase FITM2-like [Gigantopelta aegis]|uniref:acyl-coenzyme A diphosphatase FITM2-like n=1 Tax=Gigantopelta aegis TaxID=1735272 RepID=UPI001B8890EA|nr:acyl-coenzyme A diphosphatase FITM2-like [Gigantopelta aegis]